MFIELYDVKNDSQEMTNLAFQSDEHGSRIERMLDCLRQYMQNTNDLLKLPDDLYDRFLGDYGQFKI